MSCKKTIADIVEFNPKRQIKIGEAKPFIEMAALPVNNRDVGVISKKEFKGGGSKFKNGDTLFARITPCLENGKTAKVNCLNEDEHGYGSTEFIVMSAKEQKNDEDYVYYLARHPDFRVYAQSRMEGTSGRQRVAWQSLAEFEFNYPDKDIRKKAGKFLKEIDDKIALNAQTNQTLEQIAQALFKSWFVDFDPVKAKIGVLEAGGTAEDAELATMSIIAAKSPEQLAELKQTKPKDYEKLAETAALFPAAMRESELGEIPEGWRVGNLADIIHFNPQRSLKKGTVAPYLDMKNVPTAGHLAIDVVDRKMASGTKFINGDTLLARITPCLENGKTAYVDFLSNGQVGWGSTEYIVIRPREQYPTSIGYFLAREKSFRQYAIMSMTGTSGRQRADAKSLSELPWLVYPKNIVNIFDETAICYLETAKNNGDESKTLSNIRDALLPKLLGNGFKGD